MTDASAEMIEIEVACAMPQIQVLLSLRLPAETTAQEAVRCSGVLSQFPELDVDPLCIGVFGRQVPPEQLLVDGDRVELYRPLIADPKQSRRRRARQGAR